jgi:mono/diheme cytochrome c family protein
MSMKHLAAAAIVVVWICAFAASAQQDSAPKAKVYRDPARTQPEGERIFKQQCSRCHTAPEGFSPRISGTIVRHMRVRASLSQHEEEELLHFFNP